MFNTLLRWLVTSFVLVFIAWVVPGIEVENFSSAMIACVVIALINAFIKPVLQFISLPVSVLTLGLFSLVINALLFMLAGYITPGVEVNGFLSALIGSVILSLAMLGISKI